MMLESKSFWPCLHLLVAETQKGNQQNIHSGYGGTYLGTLLKGIQEGYWIGRKLIIDSLGLSVQNQAGTILGEVFSEVKGGVHFFNNLLTFGHVCRGKGATTWSSLLLLRPFPFASFKEGPFTRLSKLYQPLMAIFINS